MSCFCRSGGFARSLAASWWDGCHAFCGPPDVPDRPAWLDRSLASGLD